MLTKVVTAEFQVAAIRPAASSAEQMSGVLQTRIRYEIVGTGTGFHREQRVGYWDLVWKEIVTIRGFSFAQLAGG